MAQDKTVDDLTVEGNADLAGFTGGLEFVGSRSGNDRYTIDTAGYNFLIVFWNAIDFRSSDGDEPGFLIVDEDSTQEYETRFADGSTSSTARGHKISDASFSGRRTAGSVMIAGGGGNEAPVTIQGWGNNRASQGQSSTYTLLDKTEVESGSPLSVSLVDGLSFSDQDVQGGNFVVFGANY